MMSVILIAACSVAVIGTVAGCGGSAKKSEATGEVSRQLTAAEADLMAGALYANYETGSSHFQAATPAGADGGTLALTGSIDFRNHLGEARVSSPSGRYRVTDVLWGPRAVIEYRPGLAAAIAKVKPGAKFVIRPVDRQHRRIDQVLEVLTALAARKRENPLLILQHRGAGFVREDTLRGRNVKLLRYGPRTILWIDPATGRMLRFESSNRLGNAVVVVDLYPARGLKVTPPPAAMVIPASALGSTWTRKATTSP